MLVSAWAASRSVVPAALAFVALVAALGPLPTAMVSITNTVGWLRWLAVALPSSRSSMTSRPWLSSHCCLRR